MSIETLLSILADGDCHSGDDLGKLLGVSRTAVWKQLKKMEGLGISLESIKGRGYRIPGGLDLLSEEQVRATLSAETSQLIAGLELANVVDSTNSMAMTHAAAVTSGKAYVCSAERQLAGRGRRGRNWVSPYAANLYLSVVWEFAGGAAALEGLSLAVGVAVVEALQVAGISGVQLKWPNDVLHSGRKLAGILLEVTGDAAGPCQVIVGIGLNVRMGEVAGDDVGQPWTDISLLTPEPPSRSELLALLLNKLMPLLSGFERQGFSAYRGRWLELDAYAGRDVKITLGQDIVLGRATGVDSSGAVIVETAAGRRTFNGGEVSLRSLG